MSKALSMDLRERVLAAVADGMSGRQAAIRFGVSAASVSRWRALERGNGHARPGPLGGDRRSGRIESHAALILELLAETPDQSLDEIAGSVGQKGPEGGLWRAVAVLRPAPDHA